MVLPEGGIPCHLVVSTTYKRHANKVLQHEVKPAPPPARLGVCTYLQLMEAVNNITSYCFTRAAGWEVYTASDTTKTVAALP